MTACPSARPPQRPARRRRRSLTQAQGRLTPGAGPAAFALSGRGYVSVFASRRERRGRLPARPAGRTRDMTTCRIEGLRMAPGPWAGTSFCCDVFRVAWSRPPPSLRRFLPVWADISQASAAPSNWQFFHKQAVLVMDLRRLSGGKYVQHGVRAALGHHVA